MKITQLDQSVKILGLLTEIKNKGIADVFCYFASYSCVNSLTIDIHYPKWSEDEHFKIKYETHLDSVNNSKTIIKELEDILNGDIEKRADVIKYSSLKNDRIKKQIDKLKNQLKETA